MPPITTLAQELLGLVVQHCREDLYALSLTCKALRIATLEALYERVVMKSEHYIFPTDDAEKRCMIITPRLRLLLRTLLENPDYAHLVHELELRDLDSRPTSHGNDMRPKTTVSSVDLLVQDIPEIGQHAAKLGLSDAWRNAINKNDTTALMSLLVFLCKNVRHLSLQRDSIRENHFLQEALMKVARSESPFRELKTISIGFSDRPRPRDLIEETQFIAPHLYPATYLSCLYFPAVEEASMDLLMPRLPDALAWPGVVPVPEATTLKVLNLHMTSLTPIALRSLLLCTPGLTTLEYYFCFNYEDPLECQGLMSALEVVQTPLAHLRVSCMLRKRGNLRQEQYYGYIKGNLSAQRFTSLISLQISPCILFGLSTGAAPALSELLPQGLRSIGFHSDIHGFEFAGWPASRLLKTWTDFLATRDRAQVTPYLEELVLSVHDNLGRWVKQEEAGTFETLCAHHGLRCRLRYD